MAELAVLVAIGLGTYGLRSLFLLTGGGGLGARGDALLPHVGPAVLAAITVPALVAPHGAISVPESVPACAAAVACWAIWRRTQLLPVSLLGGLSLWWLLVALVPGA